MNGKAGRYLLDTNAVIALLQGHKKLVKTIYKAEWLAISIVTQLEFLSFPSLAATDADYFQQFAQRVHVIGLGTEDQNYLDTIIRIRQQHRLKLPDAIIAATAVTNTAVLVTADQKLHTVSALTILNFVP